MTPGIRRGGILCALLLGVAATPASAWELAVCADPDGEPYSHRDGSGFDNRIAAAIAGALGAQLSFVWMPDHRLKTVRRHLHAGACDVAMGVLDGQPGFLTSHAYYRTGYVFLTPAGGDIRIASLDDPALGGLRIGIPGDAQHPTPPAVALERRGHLDNLRHFPDARDAGRGDSVIVQALADGRIDVAILWGPVAGALAKDATDLAVTPVRPQIDIPFVPMIAALAIGVRPHDEALRDAIDRALAARWTDVQAVLEEAGVPTLPVPRPVADREAGR